jgi:hypothetical protein
MPYVVTNGAVHADNCPHILPDVDPARYVSETPEDRLAADCDCRTA